jgi:ribosomal-protein-alanine N-acetyltransferase
VSVELRLLPVAALEALEVGDLPAASAAAGLALPAEYLEDGPLWRLRLGQIAEAPASAPWLVRAIVADGLVVGHAGFHGPPDAAGMVEAGYVVFPPHRRRGHARAALGELARYAAAHGARTLRAAVGPDNAPSLALIRSEGFTQVGEQWDSEDGRELVFERPLPQA